MCGEKNPPDRRANDDSVEKYRLSFEESQMGISAQIESLESLRSRGGTVVAAASL